jgi:putative transposase
MSGRKSPLVPLGVYHVINRGVERRQLFMDSHDYRRFKLQMSQAIEREPDLFILAYCLMPNHLHMLLSQTDSDAIRSFMHRLTTAYAMYFNRRHRRVGPLFQGTFKAIPVTGPQQLMEVSRYIHLNPERAGLGWLQHQHSSVADYLGERSDGLAYPEPVLRLLDRPGDYRRYLSQGRALTDTP